MFEAMNSFHPIMLLTQDNYYLVTAFQHESPISIKEAPAYVLPDKHTICHCKFFIASFQNGAVQTNQTKQKTLENKMEMEIKIK